MICLHFDHIDQAHAKQIYNSVEFSLFNIKNTSYFLFGFAMIFLPLALEDEDCCEDILP